MEGERAAGVQLPVSKQMGLEQPHVLGTEPVRWLGMSVWCMAWALTAEGHAISASGDGTVRLWDLESGEERRQRQGLDRFATILEAARALAGAISSNLPLRSPSSVRIANAARQPAAISRKTSEWHSASTARRGNPVLKPRHRGLQTAGPMWRRSGRDSSPSQASQQKRERR